MRGLCYLGTQDRPHRSRLSTTQEPTRPHPRWLRDLLRRSHWVLLTTCQADQGILRLGSHLPAELQCLHHHEAPAALVGRAPQSMIKGYTLNWPHHGKSGEWKDEMGTGKSYGCDPGCVPGIPVSWPRQVLSARTRAHPHTPAAPPRPELPCSSPSSPAPNLLQLVEFFTFAQQPAQWLHVLLTEATVREPAGGGATSQGGAPEPLRPALPWLVLGVASSSHGASPKVGFSGTTRHPPRPPPPQQMQPGTPRLLTTGELLQMQI